MKAITQEIGQTIRMAIRTWPYTLRLMSLIVVGGGVAAVIGHLPSW